MANEEEMASDQNSKKGAITLAIENNPCGICRAMGYPFCKGHGGAGGGSDSDETKKDVTQASTQVLSKSGQVAIAPFQEFDKAKTNWVQSQLLSDRSINYDAGLLSIESDRLRGNLTFRIKPGLSKDDIETSQQFLKTVKAEFDEFKDRLIEQGVPTINFTAIFKDDELSIHIPIPKYYDAFIKHLENKNLLPTPNPERQEKTETASNEKNQPSPFGDISKGPTPKDWK